MKKNSKSGKGTLFGVALLFIMSVVVGVYFAQMNTNNITNPISKNPSKSSNIPLSTLDEATWWNTSWRYRVQINITESGYASRENEPVDVWINFTDLSPTNVSSCGNDSIRVLEYSGSWEILPSQVWNVTYQDGNISTAVVTFQVNISQSETKSYYIYYNE
ncbi:MAG: hypothetical protein ACTSR3_06080, partial [Candidatus Helarchaeota archaeon]